jgi:hypothetical protein
VEKFFLSHCDKKFTVGGLEIETCIIVSEPPHKADLAKLLRDRGLEATSKHGYKCIFLKFKNRSFYLC